MSFYSLEKLFQIWDDRTGDCIEVGPDRDALDLLEIRVKESVGSGTSTYGPSITFSKEQAKLIATALLDLTEETK